MLKDNVIVRFFSSYLAGRQRSRTVRYMFPAVLGAATAFGALALSATEHSFVRLVPDLQIVEEGQVFSVEVLSSVHTPVNAVDIQVEFPADKVAVLGVDRGQSVLTIWTEDPIVTNKDVTLRGGTFRKGFIGEHQIATIKFRAKQTGSYDIRVGEAEYIAGDGEGTIVAVSEHPANMLTMFNFDEATTEEEINTAIKKFANTDVNQDGRVTLQDISAFMGAWSNRTQFFDFNNDGKMTFQDFSIILADFFFQR